MRTTRWMAGALGAVLALGGCESTTEPVQESGEVRFTFSGDTTGSFEAVGAITRVNSQRGTYAAGAVQTVPQGRYLSVIGQRGGAGRVDGVIVNVEAPETGTFSCTEETEDCPLGVIYAVGLSETQGEETEAIFFSTGGTVTITSITSRRAQGTFTATLEELTFDGEPRIIQATGSFDVPLLSEWAT